MEQVVIDAKDGDIVRIVKHGTEFIGRIEKISSKSPIFVKAMKAFGHNYFIKYEHSGTFESFNENTIDSFQILLKAEDENKNIK